jgi:hypothetical protein
MSFRIKNAFAKLDIWNAGYLQGTNIDLNLGRAAAGDVLTYTGTMWTYGAGGGSGSGYTRIAIGQNVSIFDVNLPNNMQVDYILDAPTLVPPAGQPQTSTINVYAPVGQSAHTMYNNQILCSTGTISNTVQTINGIQYLPGDIIPSCQIVLHSINPANTPLNEWPIFTALEQGIIFTYDPVRDLYDVIATTYGVELPVD